MDLSVAGALLGLVGAAFAFDLRDRILHRRRMAEMRAMMEAANASVAGQRALRPDDWLTR